MRQNGIIGKITKYKFISRSTAFLILFIIINLILPIQKYKQDRIFWLTYYINFTHFALCLKYYAVFLKFSYSLQQQHQNIINNIPNDIIQRGLYQRCALIQSTIKLKLAHRVTLTQNHIFQAQMNSQLCESLKDHIDDIQQLIQHIKNPSNICIDYQNSYISILGKQKLVKRQKIVEICKLQLKQVGLNEIQLGASLSDQILTKFIRNGNDGQLKWQIKQLYSLIGVIMNQLINIKKQHQLNHSYNSKLLITQLQEIIPNEKYQSIIKQLESFKGQVQQQKIIAKQVEEQTKKNNKRLLSSIQQNRIYIDKQITKLRNQISLNLQKNIINFSPNDLSLINPKSKSQDSPYSSGCVKKHQNVSKRQNFSYHNLDLNEKEKNGLKQKSSQQNLSIHKKMLDSREISKQKKTQNGSSKERQKKQQLKKQQHESDRQIIKINNKQMYSYTKTIYQPQFKGSQNKHKQIKVKQTQKFNDKDKMDKNEQIKACQWVDPKCHYFKSMTFENNKITVNRGSYVFGKPLNLSNKETENQCKSNKFSFTVSFQKIHIIVAVGVVDTQYRQRDGLYGCQNRIQYCSDSRLYGINEQQVDQLEIYKVKDTIKVIMGEGIIKWEVNGKQKCKYSIDLLKDESIVWVPYIYLSDKNDSVMILQ